MIAMQLYERLKDLHSLGIVHSDLKPDNILIDQHVGSTINLIDFGLSQYFQDTDPQTGLAVHRQRVNLNIFTGNFIFASLNSLQGNSKSRQDDIESAFYMIMYLLNRNSLPWMYLCNPKYSFSEKLNARFHVSLQVQFEKLLHDCNFSIFNTYLERLKSIFQYVRNLEFEEDPDYDFIILHFKEILSTLNSRHYKFDWQKNQRFTQSALNKRNMSMGAIKKADHGGESDKSQQPRANRTPPILVKQNQAPQLHPTTGLAQYR